MTKASRISFKFQALLKKAKASKKGGFSIKLSPLNFLYLAMLSFLFISTTALLFSKLDVGKLIKDAVLAKKDSGRDFTAVPILKQGSTPFPIVSAQAAMAIDIDSRVSLYEKDPDKPLLPASTTKIVTGLVAMDYYPKDMQLTVDGQKVEGQKMGLVKGEKITVASLIEGLLVYSANDAAEVLAYNYPGGREAFVEAMNAKAAELHLRNTRFENPVGFDGDNQVSTARDLIYVAEIAMQNSEFARIVGQKKVTLTSIDGKIVHKLTSTNQLLGEVEGVIGVKTGWTENARENLVTYIQRNGRKVMIVLLGSQDRFGETKELINWIFDNYQWREVKYQQEQ
jgi:D-alanyl-D-alanine carboxypeptidase (penicillin-binding protein 5/6)